MVSPPIIPPPHSVSMRVKRGELVAVVGHVGAGKSSLIQALLGEMEKTSRTVSLRVRPYYIKTSFCPGADVHTQ